MVGVQLSETGGHRRVGPSADTKEGKAKQERAQDVAQFTGEWQGQRRKEENSEAACTVIPPQTKNTAIKEWKYGEGRKAEEQLELERLRSGQKEII